jgi:NDP-sugar pyrophosphorylase family protein
VILAGGKGTRLAPYSVIFPKPLMPLGEMPILEFLLCQLRNSGITSVTIAVGHLSSLIMAYFGSGEKLKLPIEYSHEETPLGTAGPLGLIKGLDEPFFVMNGDLLTDIDIHEMVKVHRAQRAAATIGLYKRDVTIDLGVIESDEVGQVTRYIEKPEFHYDVSMGIYVFEPRILNHIPPDKHFDLPDLIRALISAGERVVGFRHEGYWRDIGRPDDYRRAQEDFPELCARVLGTGPEAGRY